MFVAQTLQERKKERKILDVSRIMRRKSITSLEHAHEHKKVKREMLCLWFHMEFVACLRHFFFLCHHNCLQLLVNVVIKEKDENLLQMCLLEARNFSNFFSLSRRLIKKKSWSVNRSDIKKKRIKNPCEDYFRINLKKNCLQSLWGSHWSQYLYWRSLDGKA